MRRRDRLAIALIVIVGAGLCVAASAASVLTVLDGALAVPQGSEPQPAATAATVASGHGLEIGLFLAFAVALIAISVGASMSDRSSARSPVTTAAPRGGSRLPAAPILARRQEG